MKIPICDICAKSGVICSGCEEKLRKGQLTEADVAASKLLYKLKEKYNLESADISKVLDLGRLILVLTKGDVGVLIGREGKVVSELSHAFGKKVRIAEMSGDVKKTISDIILPAKLLGINTVYKGGEKRFRVRFLRSEIKQIPVDINTLEKALNSIMDAKVQIAFE